MKVPDIGIKLTVTDVLRAAELTQLAEVEYITLWICTGAIHATRPDWCKGGIHPSETCYQVWAIDPAIMAARQREVGDPR